MAQNQLISPNDIDKVVRTSIEVSPRSRLVIDGRAAEYVYAKSIATLPIASIDDMIAIGMIFADVKAKDITDAVRQDSDEARRSFLGQRATSSESSCVGCAGHSLEHEYKSYRRQQNFALAQLMGSAQKRTVSPWDRSLDIIRRVAENTLTFNFKSLFADSINVGDASEVTFANINFISANEIVAAKDAVLNLPQVAFLKTDRFRSY